MTMMTILASNLGMEQRKENMATSEMVNTAFMGTMVVTGRATGLVVSTGEKTQFGQVRSN